MSDNLRNFEAAKSISNRWFYIKTNFKVDPDAGFAYWKYRILRPLLKIYFKFYRTINIHTPWIAPAATSILNKILTKEMSGFEYRSGLSTVFLSKQLKELTSIEHYEHWFVKVNDLLRNQQINNVRLKLVKPTLIKDLPLSPTKEEAEEIRFGDTYYDYSSYIDSVKNLPEDSLDF